jgi:uncharacterized protein YtpQ (UPF0354 family)
MKRWIRAALAVLGICSSCAKAGILTPGQFTAEVADMFRKSAPAVKVEIVKDLQLKITTPANRESTAYLDNAYGTYKLDPNAKDAVIKRFVTAGVETVGRMQSPESLDVNRIVPVVKDRAWLKEMGKVLLSRGAKEMPENVYDDLNADLVVLYAEDTPRNIRYLEVKDLEQAHIDRKELRRLACANLQRLLPKIDRRGANGIYMVTAGGDYEASLLLFDSMWNDFKQHVKGDVVVAIPARDLLIVTGSEDPVGLDKMRQMVAHAFTNASYRLTSQLFVYRNGKFQEFSPVQK